MAAHVKNTKKANALRLIKRKGIARARDLEAAGVAVASLRRLVKEGALEQPARGHYRLSGAAPAAGHTIAVASGIVPRGIVCLLSALRLHNLGTQTPHEIWMLIGAKAWAPVNPAVSLRLIRSRNLHGDIRRERADNRRRSGSPYVTGTHRGRVLQIPQDNLTQCRA
jgi:predicted transcriptional regulator of viral defense system